MAINIQTRQDVSYLFSGLSTNNSASSGVFGNSWLSDYASIKNGSYGKLMKAYFRMEKGNSDKTTSTGKTESTAEDTKNYAKVQTTSDALKEAADDLWVTGEKSLFEKKKITTKNEDGTVTTTEDYDRDAIYKAVNTFVTNYNNMMTAVGDADHERITGRAEIMVQESINNSKSLKAVGITLNENGTLSLNKENFEKAEISTVKNLFNGVGSYGYRMSSQASMVNYTADRAASSSSTYTSGAKYDTNLSGALFETYF